jgi:membrane fusion protein (multidrug efflux system)
MAEDSPAEKGDGSEQHEQPPSPEEQRAQKAKKRRIIIIAAIVVVVLAIAILIYWIVAIRGRETTDDAFTEGRVIPIAARVTGYIATLAVNDNQFVHTGDPLLTIDTADYEASLDNARAAVEQAQAQVEAAQPNFDVQRSNIQTQLASAREDVERARVAYARAKADADRVRAVDPRATSQSQIDQAGESERSTMAQLRSAEARLNTAQLTPQSTAAEAARVRQAEAQLLSAQAQLKQAELNLGYTTLRAPQDGYVSRRSAEVGAHVQTGQTLLSLVSPQVWVIANFKEDQLETMRPGQPVALSIDAFPSLEVHGHVDSIQRGSGSRFSAFPAENATGNFVKIVQRVPVKILIDSGLDPNVPMPLGASVVPTVDMR